MNDFGKVAVLFGGTSAEREISLMSGAAVLEALQAAGVDAHAFDPAEQDLLILKKERFERAFIILHGRGGEDGTIQGALELMKIPYTGSGVLASALSMDKWRTKMIWQANQVPTPKSVILHEKSDWDAVARELGLPIFVKPVHEGSSVGANKVTTVDGLQAAWERASRYDKAVIAEAFIEGQELTIPFLGDRALPVVRINAPSGNYDYKNKYFSDETTYDCPCGLPEAEETYLQHLTMQSVQLLGCSGWGRLDLILTKEGKPYLLEMNTLPGMTTHSLVPKSAAAAGLSFKALCLEILKGARLG